MVDFEVANLRRRGHTAGCKRYCGDEPTGRNELQTATDNTSRRVAGFDVWQSQLLRTPLLAIFEQERKRIVG